MPEAELKRLYDMLAIEIAMKVRCTAVRYDTLQLTGATETAAERHVRRAEIPPGFHGALIYNMYQPSSAHAALASAASRQSAR